MPTRARWRLDLLWAGVALATGLALAAGAGLFAAGGRASPSLYERTMQVAGEYRCPVCQGESAAASNDPAAVEMRSLIEHWLSQGRTQAQVRAALVADYGPSILEKPPASGLDALVWVLPTVGGGLGAVGLGLAFSRSRRRSLALAGAGGGTRFAGGRGVAGRAGGGPAVLGPSAPPEEASEVRSPPVELPSVRLRREKGGRPRFTLVAGVGLVAVATALWLVDRASAPRLPGATITGGVTGVTGLSAELQRAASLTATDPAGALAVYDSVLSAYPGQPVALASEGWIYAEAGFPAKAMACLDQAEKADPAYAPAHLYRALVLLDAEHNPAAAASELKWYLGRGALAGTAALAHKALAQAEAEAETAGGAPRHRTAS